MRKFDINTMRRLYEEWESSGMSMKAFSLKNNINSANFNYWTKSIRKERQKAPAGSFLRLPMPKEVKMEVGWRHYVPVGNLIGSLSYPGSIFFRLSCLFIPFLDALRSDSQYLAFLDKGLKTI